MGGSLICNGFYKSRRRMGRLGLTFGLQPPLSQLRIITRQGCSGEVSELLTRGARYFTRNMASKTFVCAARTTFFCVLVLTQKNVLMRKKMIILPDNCTTERLNRSKAFRPKSPAPTADDSAPRSCSLSYRCGAVGHFGCW